MNRREFLISGVATAVIAKAAPAPAESAEVDVAKNIPYREGNKAWMLDLAMPRISAQPTPVIVMIHGGGWIEGDKVGFDAHCLEFAKREYFCATINYGLTAGAPFPAAIEDSKCAMRWLRVHAAQYNIDRNRIGVLGNSARGHLALMLGIAGKAAGPEGDGALPGPVKHGTARSERFRADDRGPGFAAGATPNSDVVSERTRSNAGGTDPEGFADDSRD